MIEIPLEKIEIPPLGWHLLLEVKINKILTKLVLDTGASRSVVDIEYLKEIIPTISFEVESGESAGVGGSNLESFVGEIEELAIGDLTLKNYEMAVMDLSHVKQSYINIGEEPIYGVLGSDLLVKYNAIIDYRNLKLRLND